MWKKLVSVAFLTALVGCGSGYVLPGLNGKTIRLAVSGPTSVPTYVCVKYTVSATNEDGTPFSTTEAITASVSGLGSGLAFTTLAACQNGDSVTSLVIPSGTSSIDFFFRTTAAETLTITASANGVPEATFALSTYLFDVIGQPNGYTISQFESGQASPQGVTAVANKLFIADSQAARVTTHSVVSRWSDILKQVLYLLFTRYGSYIPFLGTSRAAEVRGAGAYAPGPTDVASDGTRLYVVDNNGHRVLVYNTIPTAFADPDFIIGQANLTDVAANHGNGGVSDDKGLLSPNSVATNGTYLAVADSGNHRVLIFTLPITGNLQAATAVVGQPDFATHASGTTSQKFATPQGVAMDTHLYVADTSNHRVAYFATIPTTNNQALDFIYGQAADNAAVPGLSQTALSAPARLTLASNGTKLFVSDRGNSRVLSFDAPPVANLPMANQVLGQSDFITGTTGVSATRMSFPTGLVAFDGGLVVTDTSNSRTLLFSTIPTSNGGAATGVIGQANLTSNGVFNLPTSAKTLRGPYDVTSDGTRLFVSDIANGRVLVWNTIPSSLETGADIAIGQADLTSSGARGGGTTATRHVANKVVSDGTKLFLAESADNRVVIFNQIPTTNFAAADIALGQTDLTTNGFGTTQTTLKSPNCVFRHGTKVFVCDTGNHRVLIWNTVPTSNAQPADLVLGQPDFTTGTSGTTQLTLKNPSDIYTNGTLFYVLDSGNRRVLGWNAIPTTNAQPPDFVLGQADFVSSFYNKSRGSEDRIAIGPPTQLGFHSPVALAGDGKRLFVSDPGNNRITVWSPLPTTTLAPATAVIGQPDFVTSYANSAYRGVTASNVRDPRGIFSDGVRLFYTDYYQYRVGIVPAP